MTTETTARMRHPLGGMAPTGCRVLAAVFIAASAGCEPQKQDMGLDQQIAQQVEPVEQRIRQQESSTRVAHEQMQARLAALEATLADQRDQIEKISARLQAAEGTLAAYAEFDFAALVQATEAFQTDLRQLRGDHTGHVYNAGKQFEDFKLIHANFEQANDDLRKLIASSVTGLERRAEHARQEAEDRLANRFDQDRSVVTSAFRELERQVEAGRARTALAMQLLAEFLKEEHSAVAAHADRLEAVQSEVDQQFAPDVSGERERQANELFDRAREFHRQYLADPYRAELLDEAILAYSKGLALRPGSADMHYELGKLLHDTERDDDARPHLLYYLKSGQDAEKRKQIENWLAPD